MHEVESNNLVYVGEQPWHGIGEQLNATDNASLEEVLNRKPIFNSEIIHRPVFCEDGNGGRLSVSDAYVAVREYDNKALAAVGKQQMLSDSSPRRLLQSLQNIVGVGKAMIHTAMYLRDGKVFVATCKLGNPIEVTSPGGSKDTSDFYLVAATAFDGSMRTALYDTIVRTVCMNTFRASYSDASSNDRKLTKIKHTSGHEERLNDAKTEWGTHVARYELFKRTIEVLARTPISDSVANGLFKLAFGLKIDEDMASVPKRTMNNLELVQNLYAGGMGNAVWQGTAWGCFNSLSEFADHNMVVRGVRDSSGVISDSSESARAKLVDSALFGAAASFKTHAFELLTKTVGL